VYPTCFFWPVKTQRPDLWLLYPKKSCLTLPEEVCKFDQDGTHGKRIIGSEEDCSCIQCLWTATAVKQVQQRTTAILTSGIFLIFPLMIKIVKKEIKYWERF
jgi:hypothetical protein